MFIEHIFEIYMAISKPKHHSKACVEFFPLSYYKVNSDKKMNEIYFRSNQLVTFDEGLRW